MSVATGSESPKPPRISKYTYGLLSLAGVFIPGLQRVYLKQYRWAWGFLGVALFILPFFPLFFKILSYLLRAFCFAEGLWILTMSNQDFEARFNPAYLELEWTSVLKKKKEAALPQDPEQQLEAMRSQGLITEAEYQERRQRIRERLGGHPSV